MESGAAPVVTLGTGTLRLDDGAPGLGGGAGPGQPWSPRPLRGGVT
jgi:hypothetical protein